jgi:hypothetical protein
MADCTNKSFVVQDESILQGHVEAGAARSDKLLAKMNDPLAAAWLS